AEQTEYFPHKTPENTPGSGLVCLFLSNHCQIFNFAGKMEHKKGRAAVLHSATHTLGTKGERAWRWFYPNTTGGPCRHAAKWMLFAPQARAAQNRIEPAQSAGVKGRRACWIQAKNSPKTCTERRSVGT